MSNLWENVEIKYDNFEYLIKFKEHRGYITVSIHKPTIPYTKLNRNCEYTGFHLLGKGNLIKSAIYQYEDYKNSAKL